MLMVNSVRAPGCVFGGGAAEDHHHVVPPPCRCGGSAPWRPCWTRWALSGPSSSWKTCSTARGPLVNRYGNARTAANGASTGNVILRTEARELGEGGALKPDCFLSCWAFKRQLI